MNLLLLTANFPYDSGEEFLEEEIRILSKNFEKILIVPLNLRLASNALIARPVPDNAQIMLLPQDLSRRYKRQKALCASGLFTLKDLIIAAVHARISQPSKLRWLCVQYFTALLQATLIFQNVDLKIYDIIYSYWGAEKGLVIHFLKRKCSEKKIFAARVHGYDVYAERANLKRLPFQKFLLNACDIIAPCSSHGEAYLKDKYRQSAKKIRHFYLGVATQNFINKGSIDDILRIVTCSSIIPVKRLELIIAALAGMSRQVSWTHIGDGVDRKKIHELSKNLPRNIQAIFLGYLENKDVLEYYRNNPIDLFVNVSSSEGVPVSMMEALSFGIEPVATDVGGVSELVKSEFGTILDSEFHAEDLLDILQKHHNSQERKMKAQEYQRHYFSLNNYELFSSELLAFSKSKH